MTPPTITLPNSFQASGRLIINGVEVGGIVGEILLAPGRTIDLTFDGTRWHNTFTVTLEGSSSARKRVAQWKRERSPTRYR
ncbi:hypothetical protein [Burkholderia anthina]|uniref:hypothetical protein n=1 Tax=Burkholderia anthina TaxID=179879 RepID=UPI00158F47D8|nr:hypothetical protein [Burkholderia anthina]